MHSSSIAPASQRCTPAAAPNRAHRLHALAPPLLSLGPLQLSVYLGQLRFLCERGHSIALQRGLEVGDPLLWHGAPQRGHPHHHLCKGKECQAGCGDVWFTCGPPALQLGSCMVPRIQSAANKGKRQPKIQ